MPARPSDSTASTPAAWASASTISTPGMIGRSGEMAGEEGLVDRHRLGGDDPLVDDEFLDAIDEEHRKAMRQRRHHPSHVETGR